MNSEVCNSVLEHLKASKYPIDLHVHYSSDMEPHSHPYHKRMRSSDAVHQLLHSRMDQTSPSEELELLYADHLDHAMLIYPKNRNLFTPSNPHIDLHFLRKERLQNSSSSSRTNYIPPTLRESQLILIYQSLGTVSGGTVALELLHQRLLLLGFKSILCDSQMTDERCLWPTGSLPRFGSFHSSRLIYLSFSGSELVITGEWCHGVLESHGERPSAFRGRGIQYHLGFHHFDDLCRLIRSFAFLTIDP
jgi:hypothetical protein